MGRKNAGLADCPNCEQLRRECERLRRSNAGKEHRIQDLLRKLRRAEALLERAKQELKERTEAQRPTASNSSLPPSANPPGAPKPVIKKPTGRKRGAQVGHKGHSRKLLPTEQVHQVIVHRPAACQHCQANLKQAPAELLGRHQIAELPEVAVQITEHQSYACRCPACGKLTREMIPAALRCSSIGPRLCGAIGLLSGFVHGSRRAVAEVVSQMLGCPIALGSISARERELSEALVQPYQQLVQKVAEAKVKNVDESGWKLKGQRRWLWVAGTACEAVFRVDRERNHPALLRLLGGEAKGYFGSDRAGLYDLLPLEKRQLCWSHLKRDFTRCQERGGPSQEIGRQGLEICQGVFDLWWDFQARRLSRRQLQQRLGPLQRKMHRLLKEGGGCGIKKTAGFCRRLWKRRQALWRFAYVMGLEPTNNRAERLLRSGVIWRKISFGSDSVAGCRFVERMLSVIQTLRLRGQDVLDYLAEAVRAHRQGQAAPAIVKLKGRGSSAPRTHLPQDLRKVA